MPDLRPTIYQHLSIVIFNFIHFEIAPDFCYNALVLTHLQPCSLPRFVPNGPELDEPRYNPISVRQLGSNISRPYESQELHADRSTEPGDIAKVIDNSAYTDSNSC